MSNRLMTKPRIVLPDAEMVKPLTPRPALLPSSSMTGVPAKPGCVVPLI